MTAIYTTKTDNVDVVYAADVNELQAGVGFAPIPGGRLTLETGVPVSTTDQSAKTTLYYTAYHSNRIGLYNGTAWEWISFSSDLSITLAALTASTPYDVFCYNNSGTATLELLAWTNATTRATALTRQDGRLVKSGAATRLYLGTVYINSSGGQTDDSQSKRYVWNMYNRVGRSVLTYNSTSSWSTTSAVRREYNNGTGQIRGEYVIGLQDDTFSNVWLAHEITGTYLGSFGLSYDTTSGSSALVICKSTNANITVMQYGSEYFSAPPIGYHYITLTELIASGTATINGQNYRGGGVIIRM